MIDTIFHWRAEQRIEHLVKPYFRLRVFERTEATVVIATQLATSGLSISQNVEHLANLVQKCFKIYPEHLVWIEHFGPESFTLSPLKEDQYSLVVLRWNERSQAYVSGVEWVRISSFVLSPLLIPRLADERQIPAHELQPLWNEVTRAREEAWSSPQFWCRSYLDKLLALCSRLLS